MRYRVKKNDILLLSACLFAFSLCTYGFFKAFAFLDVATDIFGFLLAGCILLFNGIRLRSRREQPILFWLLVAFFAGTAIVAVVSCHSPRLSILGCRNYLLYIAFGILLSEIKERVLLRHFLTFLTWVGAAVCLFAIFQFLFYEMWPSALVRYEGSIVEGVYFGDGGYLFRVNGLLENTIVFGGFATAVCVLLFAKLLTCGFRVSDLVLLLISGISLLFTFGRIAIVGAVCCAAFLFFFCGKGRYYIKLLAMAGVVVLGLAVLLIFFGDTALVQRLLGSADFTNTSDEGHFRMIMEALGVISQNFVFGVGMGTQGYNRGPIEPVITDGGWFSLCLELGVPMTCVLIAAMVIVLIYTLRTYLKSTDKLVKWANITASCLSLYFLVAGFLNSSFTALANYGIYWCIVGVALGINLLSKARPKEDTKDHE